MQKSQSLFLVLLAILSGVFIGTSYIPFTAYALFFCMVPLWSIWLFQSLSPIKVFFYGWITQFVLALIGFHWVYHTAVEFGHLHPILALLILFLFCATQNLHIPLAGPFVEIFPSQNALHTTKLPLFFSNSYISFRKTLPYDVLLEFRLSLVLDGLAGLPMG